MATYKVTSLDDLADTFERFAAQADSDSRSPRLAKRDQRKLHGEAYAWRMAARMVRDTKIVPEEKKP